MFGEESVKNIFNENKEQFKSMFAHGKQYNEFKINSNNNNQTLQSKGWLTLCQQFNICDAKTADKMMKSAQK